MLLFGYKHAHRLGGYPPFSDEIKEYSLQDQICNARYSFPTEYWKDVTSDGMLLIGMTLLFELFYC